MTTWNIIQSEVGKSKAKANVTVKDKGQLKTVGGCCFYK